MVTGNWPSAQVELFGPIPYCEKGKCRSLSVAYVSDEWGDGAWLCRSDLKGYQLKVLSIGITLNSYLRGAA